MARTDYVLAVGWWDAAGLVGVVVLLIAYGLTVAGRIDAQGVPALLGNLVGALLILLSLLNDFNLSAAVIESAWALIALAGLVRRLLGPRSG